jgi:hypothetical protein
LAISNWQLAKAFTAEYAEDAKEEGILDFLSTLRPLRPSVAVNVLFLNWRLSELLVQEDLVFANG